MILYQNRRVSAHRLAQVGEASDSDQDLQQGEAKKEASRGRGSCQQVIESPHRLDAADSGGGMAESRRRERKVLRRLRKLLGRENRREQVRMIMTTVPYDAFSIVQFS